MKERIKPYPKYKDSGVPWLGDVPEHWDTIRLGHLGRFFKGNGGSKADENISGVPCIRYGDLYTQYEFFIRKTRSFVTEGRAESYTRIQFGDVLFAASGETFEDIGRSAVNLLESDARCGGDIVVFRCSRSFVPEYLGYACDSHGAKAEKARMGRGFTVIHIYSGDLKTLTVAVPSVVEQGSIVHFLNHADARIRRFIRAKRTLIDLLEEEKQAIVHRGITRGYHLNVRLKPSGVPWLGDVPEDREIVRLGRLVELTTGFPFKSQGFTQSPDDIRLLRGINVSTGEVRWNNVVRWPSSEAAAFSDYQLRVGDIVLGMDRPLIRGGIRVARIQENDLPSLLLQRVGRIRAREGISTDFLMLLLAGASFSNYLRPIFTGISVPHLSPEQIKAFQFALPKLQEQEEIVGRLAQETARVQTAIARTHREISLLREYTTRLISDVVTGKLDVRQAAAKLPEEIPETETLDEIDDLAQDDLAADADEAEAVEEA